MQRPTGISILSFLFVGGGIVGGLMMVPLWGQLQRNQEAVRILNMAGMPPVLVAIGLLLLLVLAVAAGVGMWVGAKWGWYLGSFYYLYGILRNANALISVSTILGNAPAEELANASRGPMYYYLKFGIRIVICLSIYLYFFSETVRDYFDLSERKRSKDFSAELGVCIALATAFSILAGMMS